MLKRLLTATVIGLSLLLVACGDKAPENEQPGPAAIAFFEAIYNQQDLTTAVELATPQYGRILESYHSAKRVQSVLFNRRYDTVKIEEDKAQMGRSLIPASAKKATVSLMLDGTYDGNRYRDIKYVVMVKQQGKWLVDKLKADVYR
ncbi:hypothetical protein DS2_14439 [Catenovulum agarivorans DS-2]|uniref:Lipoprotein n=1 Tax=Catenovulum agarivorans DS-2 TaxID=1328313 RepID=W7QMC9_9ALTE|nr:hypothetical protein [Catenovulum agarivorans]EWH09078.1 hypothetical protein DS2_14439 [Catenovulum agarivorans DS-2]